MTRLWFCVPCHGRLDIARVCLRQLRRTCDAVADLGIEASAVVIADDENLDTARDLGFATVRRDNDQLGRKFNDGYQLACDYQYNPWPADYVVPCGSDDWVDPAALQRLPPRDAIGVFHQLAVVDEQRARLARLNVTYRGGAGVRIIPRKLIWQAGHRPSDEDRKRAIDTSTLVGLTRANNKQLPRMVTLDVHPLQIVDWKSSKTQLNSYETLRSYSTGESTDPFSDLASVYPAEAIAEMRAIS